MPRTRRVDPAFRHEHRPDRGEKPWQHPLGWTREQVALVSYNTHVRQREQAIEDARSAGSIVRIPPEWSTWERTLPPANAHQATRWLALPSLRLDPGPLEDVLDARRPLASTRVHVATATGTFVEISERWRAHDREMQRATNGDVEPHAATLDVEPASGVPLAIVTATSGSARAQVRSTHVARVHELLGAAHVSVEAARAAAHRQLVMAREVAPLAIVRSGAGVHVARMQVPTLGVGTSSEPLIGSLAATGTSLEWRASTVSLVAIMGLDGIRWMS